MDHIEVCKSVSKTGIMEALVKFIDLMSHLETQTVISLIEDFPKVLGLKTDESVSKDKQKVSKCVFAFDD